MSYTYNISEFTQVSTVKTDRLADAIIDDIAIVTGLSKIESDTINITIIFLSALTTQEETNLDALVAAYTEPYIAPPNVYVSASQSCLVSQSTENPGDYTSIAAAFAAGETAVYVKSGVYYESADIAIPSYGRLTGESLGGVRIIMTGGKYIKIDGNGGVRHTNGTISITTNTTTVTGVGTTFTSMNAGEFIQLGTKLFDIASIESDTSLTLAYAYTGLSLSAINYVASAMHTGVMIENMIVVASGSPYGIYMRASRMSSLSSIAISHASCNIYMEDINDASVHILVTNHATDTGMHLTNCTSMAMQITNSFCNVNYGVRLTGCRGIMFESASSENNGSGYLVDGTSYNNKFVNCMSKYNINNGVTIGANSYHNSLDDNDVVENGGIGVDFIGVKNCISNSIVSDNGSFGVQLGQCNIMQGNIVENNTTANIEIPATSDACVVTDSHINGSATGVSLKSDQVSISNNIFDGNTTGIHITGDDNIVTSNVITNSTDGIVLDSANNNISTNRIRDNTTGLLINVTASDYIVSLNNCLNNTTTISDLAVNGIVANNIS